MAWTNITNGQLAVGAPIRSVDLLALRDNIISQANGDAGAPKQQTAGIADAAVTAQKINYGTGLRADGTALALAGPAFNTIGSYCFVVMTTTPAGGGAPYSNSVGFAAGSGTGQVRAAGIKIEADTLFGSENTLSGTWRWMSKTYPLDFYSSTDFYGIACRIA